MHAVLTVPPLAVGPRSVPSPGRPMCPAGSPPVRPQLANGRQFTPIRQPARVYAGGDDQYLPGGPVDTAIFDADSHLMETPEWLGEFADDSVRGQLAPLGLEGAGAGAAELMASLPELWESHRHQEIGREVLQGPKGWMAPGALDTEVRSRVLDALQIEPSSSSRPSPSATSPGARIPTSSTAGPRP